MHLDHEYYNSLEIFFEGDSRILKQIPGKEQLLCKLKPTVFSLEDQGPVEAEGIDLVRTELNALFCEELHRNGIKTSTIKTENGLILMKKERVPPIEVIVKGHLVGSPKYIYEGITKTPTRNGSYLNAGEKHAAYVRFDWRNPLPKEDTCMPEELANYFIHVKNAKNTALQAYEILRCYCLRHDLELQDICFFMNEEGDTICAEVSTDNVRLVYQGSDQKKAELLNSREKGKATDRAKIVLELLQKPKIKFQKIIVSGSYCSGKTSLIQMLQEKQGIPKLIDHTTRPMRDHEREGFPYHFISKEKFQENANKKCYFEWIEFNQNYYGVPKKQLFDAESWALDILSSSWKEYKGHVPGVLGVYLESPDEETLKSRARQRGDDEKKIQERLQLHRQEEKQDFDLIIPAETTLEEKYQILCNKIGV